ncbi:hypothetical protein DB32_003028 [Sandaracinus amylolyticus]|uniref:Uncharacterized protein n=1 Tax=Sandaracinus amylolyticus TaxID=927083 RepID=A0A0F6SEW0_9BACT|nr:hypothetical protein DB32_003028 [Sandaracinus amylolyticus]
MTTLGALLFALMATTTARADERVVLVRWPAERGAEMTSALRLELAGRATMIEGAALEDDEPTVSAMRDAARASGATHVAWVVFPSGVLAPAEVRVLDVTRAAPAHAMTAQAWDRCGRFAGLRATRRARASTSRCCAICSPTRAAGSRATRGPAPTSTISCRSR